MIEYIVVEPRYRTSRYKTAQGDALFELFFERTNFVVSASEPANAISQAKQFGCKNPILEVLTK